MKFICLFIICLLSSTAYACRSPYGDFIDKSSEYSELIEFEENPREDNIKFIYFPLILEGANASQVFIERQVDEELIYSFRLEILKIDDRAVSTFRINKDQESNLFVAIAYNNCFFEVRKKVDFGKR